MKIKFFKKPIYVTLPSVPEKKIFYKKVDSLFKTKKLTTFGPLYEQFLSELKKYLGVKNILLVSNGTAGLFTVLKILSKKKKIITTPFSYISGVNAAHILNYEIIYSDIANDLNICPEKLKKVTLNKADIILPTHVYGNPCQIETLSNIAKKNNIKIIYDASHCFGVNYKNRSILKYGDASVMSFQATKIFNCVEGGLIHFRNYSDLLEAKKFINIGFSKQQSKPSEGLNFKLSELNCAWGLSLLRRMPVIIKKRKKLYLEYMKKLNQNITNQYSIKSNYSYFPIIFKSENKLKKCMRLLNKSNIFPRRYFYPSLNNLRHLKSNTNTMKSNSISKKILCLPLSEYMKLNEVSYISDLINKYY